MTTIQVFGTSHVRNLYDILKTTFEKEKKNVDIICRSFPGARSDQLKQLKSEHSNFKIFIFGGNDIDQKRSISELEENVKDIIRNHHESYSLFCSIIRDNQRSNNFDCQVLLANKKLKPEVEVLGVKWVDLDDFFNPTLDYQNRRHLNQKGKNKLCKKIVDVIVEQLRNIER